MPIARELTGGRVPVKVWTADLDPNAERQLENVARLPIVHRHVAAMPDAHVGIGATVGSVIATRAAVIPAAVGVDLGCGMNAVRLTLSAGDLPASLARIRGAIEDAVPVGFAMHPAAKGHGRARRKAAHAFAPGLARIVERSPRIATMQKDFEQTWVRQLGTLGGGNHFIELCVDESRAVWAMLHSGSRGVGNAIGRHFIERARREAERLDRRLPDRDLAWLDEGTEAFDQYVEAVQWAQDYALANRREMMHAILAAIAPHVPDRKSTRLNSSHIQKSRMPSSA